MWLTLKVYWKYWEKILRGKIKKSRGIKKKWTFKLRKNKINRGRKRKNQKL